MLGRGNSSGRGRVESHRTFEPRMVGVMGMGMDGALPLLTLGHCRVQLVYWLPL